MKVTCDVSHLLHACAHMHIRTHTGYFFAKASAPVKVVVMLRHYVRGMVLAQQVVPVPATMEWRRFNFSLTPTMSCGCEGIAEGSDPEVDCHVMRKGMAVPPNTAQGHVCIKCAGEFAIGLSSAGIVNVDYVFLQPGAWGR